MDPFHKHDNHREGFMKNIFHQTLTAYNKNKNSKPTEKVFGNFYLFTHVLIDNVYIHMYVIDTLPHLG